MIKWLVVAVLVAGTFGVVWTAPWKDDVENITASVRAKIDTAKKTLDVIDRATSGNCADVGKAAPATVRSAAEAVRQAAPDDESLRDAARRQADRIAACLGSLPNSGAGWKQLEADLRAAAG